MAKRLKNVTAFYFFVERFDKNCSGANWFENEVVFLEASFKKQPRSQIRGTGNDTLVEWFDDETKGNNIVFGASLGRRTSLTHRPSQTHFRYCSFYDNKQNDRYLVLWKNETEWKKASDFQVKENDFSRIEFRNGGKKSKRFSGEWKRFLMNFIS